MGKHKFYPCTGCGTPRRSDRRKLLCRNCRYGTPEERFHQRYKKMESGCWEWTAYCDPKGYGEFRMHGEKIGSHRASWTLLRGAIPEGLHVLHKCDNPPCVNPDHLFLGTHQDNMADMRQKGRAVLNGNKVSHCYGENHFNAKLTEEQARAILASSESSKVLGARYGVTREQVNKIKRGAKWAHLQSQVTTI